MNFIYFELFLPLHGSVLAKLYVVLNYTSHITYRYDYPYLLCSLYLPDPVPLWQK